MNTSPAPRRGRAKRRLTALLALASTAMSAVAVQQPASAADAAAIPVTIRWELVNPNAVGELSRHFDLDEDGRIDAPTPIIDTHQHIQDALNPEEFILSVSACTAPQGAEGFDWALARPGEEPVVTLTTTDCGAELTLPDKPYPDAVTYDVAVTVRYPSDLTAAATARVRLQDLFVVGLGDSFGSGEGNPINADTGQWDSNRCHRSRINGQEEAVRMLDLQLGITTTFLHLACSGARARAGILEPYMGVEHDEDSLLPLPPQVSQVAEYVEVSTRPDGSPRWPDIVITSIGGNDAGFAAVVKACLNPPGFPVVPPFGLGWIDLPECYEYDSSGRQAFDAGLPTLPGLYREIDRARLGEHPTLPAMCNPDDPCDFLLTEYPDGSTDENLNPCVHAGFREDEFQWVIDTMVPQLNGTLANSANELGWRYVSGIREEFNGHGVCAEDDWFRDIFEAIDLESDMDGAFHPDGDGQILGYGWPIYQNLRDLLQLSTATPYRPFSPIIIRPDSIECDTVAGDGQNETFRHAGTTDLTGLDIDPDLAFRITTGGFGQPVAGSHTCRDRAVVQPPSGVAPRSMSTGRPGCNIQELACRGSSTGSASANFPAWGDVAPTFRLSAQAEAERSAGGLTSPTYRRRSDSNAGGGSAFYAIPLGGASTVSGEIVVHLRSRTQANGANAAAVLGATLAVDNVVNEESCDEWGDCTPVTHRQLASANLSLQRSVCQERGSFVHGCEAGYGHASIKQDSTSYLVTVNGTTLSDADEITEQTGWPYSEGGVGVAGGATAPARTIRIPYSVPAGSVVTVVGSVDAGATMAEVCAHPDNGLPCDGQAHVSMTVTVEPDPSTGFLMALAGRTTPSSDHTAPVVTCSPASAWSRTEQTVTCTADDGTGVGLADPTQATFSMSTAMGAGNEGIVMLDPPRVCDGVGNCTDLPPIRAGVDRKVPSIESANAGQTYLLGQLVPASAQCADGGSGIAATRGCVASRATLLTNTAGTKSFTIDATDVLGNTVRRTITYTVSATAAAVSLGDASLVEGNSGSTRLRIPVSVSAPTAQAVTVVVSVKGGTARAQTDFASPGRVTVTIGRGDPLQFLEIKIKGDRVLELDETIELEIVSVSRNAAIGDGTAVATIVDDD